ncbi:hypothetical protein HPB47_019824 [Ixodes persulcatus]|uniref:Uncharacterized protein n=1 Tax=Ixodes persulcatus TaxID=34615 RepID=A0AC60QH13_IXOPE|nr:hypothetical protein HPB47_019824 [Ixodes persulcatus]
MSGNIVGAEPVIGVAEPSQGRCKADIARRMGLSKQTVNSIVKNKDVAEKRDSGELQEKRFRMRKAAHPEVESALLMWLRDARARGIPVNGLLLRSRAEQLAVILGHGDVTFSEGWLSRFKARHGVVFSEMCGERDSVDQTRLLFDMNAKRETKIDVKFPVEVLPAVWAQLKRDTIRNCFRKAGFCREDDAPTTPSAEPQEPCVPTVWPQIQEAFGAEDFADFVSFDDDVVNNEELTDDEIVAQVRNCSDPQSEEDSSEEAEAPVKLTTPSSALLAEHLCTAEKQHPRSSAPRLLPPCSAEVLGEKRVRQG